MPQTRKTLPCRGSVGGTRAGLPARRGVPWLPGRLVALAGVGALTAATFVLPSAAAAVSPENAPAAERSSAVKAVSLPDDALFKLTEGNGRFVEGLARGPHRDETRRCETAGGQQPFAAFLSCADSRVPVEILFDVGIGDVFVVRVAGTACGSSELASLGFAVEHLQVPLVVVLGHTRCGAVAAAAAGGSHGEPLDSLLAGLRPAVEDVKAAGVPAQSLVAAATRQHVRRTAQQLSDKPPFAAAVKAGRLRVVPAIYDIHSGVVQWLDADAGSDASTPGKPETDHRSQAGQAEEPSRGAAAIERPGMAAGPSQSASNSPVRPPLPSREAARTAPTSGGGREPHGRPGDAAEREGATDAPHGSASHLEPRSSTGDDPTSAADAPETGKLVETAREETASTRPASSARPVRENWLLLASMLAGATGASLGIIQWLDRRRG